MKNLLTYISPNRQFNEEHQMLAKVQIDNSLSLGWQPDDIMIVTNFPYEYRGIRSIVIGDNNYCQAHWPTTKVYVIIRLFDAGLVEGDVYWYHDFDCYQLVPFEAGEPELGAADLGLTNYSRRPRMCSASMFFKKGAEDIFREMKRLVDVGSNSSEEMAIGRLLRDRAMRERIKHLNITYAFHRFNILSCDKLVDKPIRAAHFHATPDKYDFFIRGDNKLGRRLIPTRLVNIFHEHGFQG